MCRFSGFFHPNMREAHTAISHFSFRTRSGQTAQTIALCCEKIDAFVNFQKIAKNTCNQGGTYDIISS